jgi:tRNA(fMet)-specific endonuclease VapC
MRYLLDTNTVIFLMNDPAAGAVARAVRRVRFEAIATSTIVVAQLASGAHRGAPARLTRNLERIAALRMPILPFESTDAAEAGRIDAALKKVGRPIGPLDTLIAGQALARGMTVVTNNVREFARVQGLRIADWSMPAR